MFAVAGAAFLLCVYLAFWALRSRTRTVSILLSRVVDVVFLVALTGMTAAAFIMIYTVW